MSGECDICGSYDHVENHHKNQIKGESMTAKEDGAITDRNEMTAPSVQYKPKRRM